MFSSQKEEQQPQPEPAIPAGSGNGAMSVVASDVSITGNLAAKGELRIDGEVKGDISCTSAIIGQTASIKGGVKAETVVVSGSLNGTIQANHVSLEPKARVEGEILYTTIAIADGAIFDGSLKNTKTPLS